MMTPDMAVKLKRSLILHEQCRNFPYIDTANKVTIGIGFNLTDRGIDDDWINNQYNDDVDFFYNQLNKTFDWYQRLCEDRQIVLIDMCFMGWKKFLEFEKMIDALSKENYLVAAHEMLNSEWANQVKGRATNLAHGMATGVYIV